MRWTKILHRTWVLKTQVSPFSNPVFFISILCHSLFWVSSSSWVSSSLSNCFSFFFFIVWQQIWRPDRASSNRLFVFPLYIRLCLFNLFKSFFLCSSSNLMFFKYKIESLKLEICVALYCQLTKWELSL